MYSKVIIINFIYLGDVMSVTLGNWCQYLNQATSDYSSSRVWICEVESNGDERHMEVLSKKDYDDFFLVHSHHNSSRRRLPLKEIVLISKWFISNNVNKIHDALKNPELSIGLTNCISLTDVFSHDVENQINDQLNQLTQLSNTDVLQGISTALDTMCQRSLNKRLVEKTESLWGEIKWHIWSCFFDKRSQINQIKSSISSLNNSCQVKIRQIFQLAKETIKDRVILNIDEFEKEIEVQPLKLKGERNSYTDSSTFNKFDSPAKVKRLWLTKYSEDKYPERVTKNADSCRKRIGAMLKIWGNLNQL